MKLCKRVAANRQGSEPPMLDCTSSRWNLLPALIESVLDLSLLPRYWRQPDLRYIYFKLVRPVHENLLICLIDTILFRNCLSLWALHRDPDLGKLERAHNEVFCE